MALLNIFKRKYVIRRFGKQTEVGNGQSAAPYSDIIVPLNVQPILADGFEVGAEGERRHKRLKSFGSIDLQATNQFTGIPGDFLFYRGYWYKCTSAAPWDHTRLSHCEAEFSAIGEGDPAYRMPKPKEVFL